MIFFLQITHEGDNPSALFIEPHNSQRGCWTINNDIKKSI